MLMRVKWREDKGKNDEDGCNAAKKRTVGGIKIMLVRKEWKQVGDLVEGGWM